MGCGRLSSCIWSSIYNMASRIDLKLLLVIVKCSKLRQCSAVCRVAGWMDIMGTLEVITKLEAGLALVLVVSLDTLV